MNIIFQLSEMPVSKMDHISNDLIYAREVVKSVMHVKNDTLAQSLTKSMIFLKRIMHFSRWIVMPMSNVFFVLNPAT
jgi:hypothetical protein